MPRLAFNYYFQFDCKERLYIGGDNKDCVIQLCCPLFEISIAAPSIAYFTHCKNPNFKLHISYQNQFLWSPQISSTEVMEFPLKEGMI